MNRKGLTLGELLVVIVVIVVLGGLLISAAMLVREVARKSGIPKVLKEQPQERFQLSDSGNFPNSPPFCGADYCVLLDTKTGHKYIYFKHLSGYHFERIEDGATNVQR